VGQGLNTVLKIELDGTNAGAANGLFINAGNSTVRGLVINRFLSDAIEIHGDGNVSEGNFIGTDIAGAVDLGNRFSGVIVFGGTGNTIGGPTPNARNIVSGNDDSGVHIQADGSDPGTNNSIQGNLIGTDMSRTVALGNASDSVVLFSSNNTVGGLTVAEANVIAGSGRGVRVGPAADATGNAILGNSIHSNSGLGIDLSPTGVTAHDRGDGDTGPNNLQNFPTISSASVTATKIQVGGTLDSIASADYWVEVFANTACDPSGFGDGHYRQWR
jgi:hypothetical protein